MRTRFLPPIAALLLTLSLVRGEVSQTLDSAPLPLPSATLQVPTPDPAPAASATPAPSLFDHPASDPTPSPAKEEQSPSEASAQQKATGVTDVLENGSITNSSSNSSGATGPANNGEEQDKVAQPEAPVTEAARTSPDTNHPVAVVDSDSKVSPALTVPVVASAPTPSIPVDAPPNMQESPEKMAASAPAPPSENVTLNLINRLVQRGILTKEDSIDLIRQAKEDAARATQQSQATQMAAQQAAAAQQMAVEAGAPPVSDESVSVSYVPEIVKTEMRDEIKRDVMAAAQSEGWTQPNYPSWISKMRPFMDFRLRYQGDYFPSGNSTNIVDTINFNAINTGIPYNISQLQGQAPYTPPPTYDTTQERTRLRLRFRFGADMNLGDNVTSGFRIATGQNGSPVSENQSMGLPGTTSQGGNFSSYAIWLDRAFLKYELGTDPDRFIAAEFGRFDNPFFTPTTIMWANDIGFDGVALLGRYKLFKGFTPFASAGIFPIYNTDLNFSSTQQPKVASYDKYLYAAQGGIDWRITKDIAFKGAAGYYYFQNAEGQVSAPQVAYGPDTQFSTDNSRPSFAQKGNTYIALRDIPATAENNYGAINQFQYFGLATPFHILSANGRLEYRHWEPFVVSLSGEWDNNLAWNYDNIVNNGPANLQGPINNPGSDGSPYGGGGNAGIIQLKVGSGALQKRWDWDFGVSYRYVESDAVIDGFCDSDFGGGGTNLKGWAVGGNLALSRSVFIGARWLSATGIAGPTYKSDILQVDLNALF